VSTATPSARRGSPTLSRGAPLRGVERVVATDPSHGPLRDHLLVLERALCRARGRAVQLWTPATDAHGNRVRATTRRTAPTLERALRFGGFVFGEPSRRARRRTRDATCAFPSGIHESAPAAPPIGRANALRLGERARERAGTRVSRIREHRVLDGGHATSRGGAVVVAPLGHAGASMHVRRWCARVRSADRAAGARSTARVRCW
jgi:hypothetical protein